jgi:phage gp45-like
MISLIRGLIKAARPAKKAANPARFDASGREGEEFEDREMFQHYGFNSRPPKGTQCLMLRDGQSVFMVASDGTEYKAKLEDGEVALYDKYDNVIHLKKSGEVLIKGGKVTVDATEATVNAGNVSLGTAATMGVLTAGSIIPCPYTPGVPHVLTGTGSKTVKAAL